MEPPILHQIPMLEKKEIMAKELRPTVIHASFSQDHVWQNCQELYNISATSRHNGKLTLHTQDNLEIDIC